MDFAQRTPSFSKETVTKWLKILMLLQIAGLILSLFNHIPYGNSLCQWLQWLCSMGGIVCLFGLTTAGKRYMTAAILGSVQLVLSMIESGIQSYAIWMTTLEISSLDNMQQFNEIAAALDLAAMIAGIVYTYQLYHAHGDLIKDMDVSLSKKWYRLFVWSLAIGILKTVAGMIFSTIYGNLNINSTALISIFYTLISIPGQIIILISIIYLYRTTQIIQNKET